MTAKTYCCSYYAGAVLLCHVTERLQKNSLGENPEAVMLKDSRELLPNLLPSEILTEPTQLTLLLLHLPATILDELPCRYFTQAQTDPRRQWHFSELQLQFRARHTPQPLPEIMLSETGQGTQLLEDTGGEGQ